MEKALTPTTNNLPTKQVPNTFTQMGLENWTPEDIVIPVLRIVQPTSQWDADAGTFFDAQTGEIFKEIEVVFIKSSWGRVKFKDNISEKGIECKSSDRIFPSVENPPAKECKLCPYSKWENGEPPACKETLNNIIYLIPKKLPSPLDGIPYLFSVHGMNIKPLKMALSSLITRGKPIYSRIFKLTLELTKNEKGKFYVVKYTPDRWLSPEITNEFAKISSSYSRETIDKSLEKAEEDWAENQEQKQTPAEEVAEEIQPQVVEDDEERLKGEIVARLRQKIKEAGAVEVAKRILRVEFKKQTLDELTIDQLAQLEIKVFPDTGWDEI